MTAIPILPGIDHVILLMFENRSFDNVLGALYPGEKYGGGVPTGWSNPWPGSGWINAWQAPYGSAAWVMPYPDPNEGFASMSVQIHDYGNMMGFVADYLSAGDAANPVDPRQIMQYFRPQNMPVTTALAQTYMASDRYFASGPVQTWANRVFSLCGTPGYNPQTMVAYLDNPDYPGYDTWDHYPAHGQLDYASIFAQLDAAGRSWRVYYDDVEPLAALVKYVEDAWHDGCSGNVWPLSYSDDWLCPTTFFTDLQSNNLATFSLLEPRYQWLSASGREAPTSNHPGSSSATNNDDPAISVSCGERLLANVYNALVAQPALFERTLLVVTYDEHGGVFDHVYPPPARSPFAPADGVQGFLYDVYGVRVPALFINPYVAKPGGLLRPVGGVEYPFDHTSLLATMREQWNLLQYSQELSPRVKAAPPFRGLIDAKVTPIVPQPLPVPDCVWSDGLTASRRRGHPMPVDARTIRATRRRGGPGRRR
jgi:phospholipase C